MNSIGELSYRQLYSYSYRNSDSKTSIAIERLNKEQEDQIIDSYPQLVSEAYRGWCIKKLRLKGKTKFIELAERSLKYGKDPQKMFVYLLK